MSHQTAPRTPSTMGPSVGLVFGGMLWGLFWIALRTLGEEGFEKAWPGVMTYSAAFVILSPLIALRWRRLVSGGRALAICGLLTGLALNFYATSLFFTDVIRVILLFYLAPVWGTILGVLWLGERLTFWRVCAVLLGLVGLIIVLAPNEGVPWPQGPGDWMALVSGLAWSLGSFQLFKLRDVAPLDQMLGFVIGALVVSAVLIGLSRGHLGALPDMATVTAALPVLLVVGVLVIPMFFLTIWPCGVLTPGRVSLLLMSEVVVAVLSAAWLTDEAFGAREAWGTLFIVSAALVEVLGPRFWPIK